MPRYDFRCNACGAVNEIICHMAEVPESVPCTHCPDSGEARRVFMPPAGIIFKGSGFYATDIDSTTRRKRRPNPGDDLPKEFDGGAARIADAI